jgi:hypothetical protein
MEQETVKLLNVLRRIARAAGYAAWTSFVSQLASCSLTLKRMSLNMVAGSISGVDHAERECDAYLSL